MKVSANLRNFLCVLEKLWNRCAHGLPFKTGEDNFHAIRTRANCRILLPQWIKYYSKRTTVYTRM